MNQFPLGPLSIQLGAFPIFHTEIFTTLGLSMVSMSLSLTLALEQFQQYQLANTSKKSLCKKWKFKHDLYMVKISPGPLRLSPTSYKDEGGGRPRKLRGIHALYQTVMAITHGRIHACAIPETTVYSGKNITGRKRK
jgi:hypothetical protein